MSIPEPLSFPSIDSTMIKIEKAHSLTSFAGRLIAFRTTSYYFGSKQGYPIAADTSLKFGYVSADCLLWKNGENGHQITRLLKATDIPGACAVIDFFLNAPLFVRLATLEETNKIRQAVDSEAARFEYVFDKECTHAVLTQHKSKL